MSFKRKFDFDNQLLAEADPADDQTKGHKFSLPGTISNRESRTTSNGSVRSRISQGSLNPNRTSHSGKATKTLISSYPALLKETYEFWIYQDLCYRDSILSQISSEGGGLVSESSGATSLLSTGSETSISCYTNPSDYFSLAGPKTFPSFPEAEYDLISSGKFRPLFEKLVFSIHSKDRVEAIKSFLFNVRISRRQEYLEAQKLRAENEEASSLLSMRDRIQDLKIKMKYHSRLQKEQQDTIQELKSKLIQVTDLKTSLAKRINQAKQSIGLKDLFLEKLNQIYLPKLDEYFFNRIRNSKQQFLEQSAKKFTSTGDFSVDELFPSTLDSFQAIQKYLSSIKINKMAELEIPLSGANVLLRHEARILAARFSYSEIIDEIATETSASAIRLATYPNLALPGLLAARTHCNGHNIYHEKIKQYFASENVSERPLVQELQKWLFPKQLELKEKALQLQMAKIAFDDKVEASCLAYPEASELERMYFQSLLLALKATQVPSPEDTYQSPPLLKLKCELKPDLVLRQVEGEVAQISKQLRNARSSVISLCRSLEISPQKLTPPQALLPLTPNLIRVCKDGARWVLSELKQASRIDFNALLGIEMCPPPIPLHTAAQFPAPLTLAQVVPASLLVIHGPMPDHKTKDWLLPLFVESRTQLRLSRQLCDSIRRQVSSHEGAWEAALRSWGSESIIALDACGLCDFEPSLSSLASHATRSWVLKPQLQLGMLHLANGTDIPHSHMLHQEIKDILCERDKLFNAFDF